MTDATPLRPARPEVAAACRLNHCVNKTPRPHGPEDAEAHQRAVVIPQRRMLITETCDAVAGDLVVDKDVGEVMSFYTAALGSGIGSAQLAAATSGRGQLSRWTFRADADVRRVQLRAGGCDGDMTSGENGEGPPDILYHLDQQSEARA